MGKNAENLLAPSGKPQEDELKLRPRTLEEFIGQEKIKEKLLIYIEAAKSRGEPLDHCLLYGPPGLGKTTIAGIIAHEMNGQLRVTTGPALERPGDLAAILTNLQPNDVLFIDEIHRLSSVVEEVLYPGMEDYHLNIIVGKGPMARNIRLQLPPFTLIGATTRLGLLTSPLRSRFGIVEQLTLYRPEELAKIAIRGAAVLGVKITEEGALTIGKRSRGTPRIALRLLKRVRDVAQVKNCHIIDGTLAETALEMLGIDYMGLDESDRKYLKVMINLFNGGPVGLTTLAAALKEEPQTIEDIYEPFLIQLGLVEKTPRGRRATVKSYKYLGIELNTSVWEQEQLDLEG